MADENMEFDLNENMEIGMNEDIDLNKEYDLTEKIVSLECENHFLLTKVDKLEATHRVELEEIEREIRGIKRLLEEQDSRWRSQTDLLCMEKDELAERKVNELLRKIDKLEATHKVELEAKEREIEHRKQMLEELDSRWKIHKDLVCMAKDSLVGKQINELLTKISELEKKLEIQDYVISQMVIENEQVGGSSGVDVDY